ncbi:unnamed protein product, partial [Rotaria sordida]
NLSSVVCQILSKDPSYDVCFGDQLSENEKYLVRQHLQITNRVDNLFSEISRDNIILSTNQDKR